MSQLTVGVNSSETLWTVDVLPDPEFGFYTIGSEIVRVRSGSPGGDPGYALGQTFPATIRVERGTNGTTAASHLSGAALTAANAFAGGGGDLPDPSGAPDGQVPTTAAGVYELATVYPRLVGPFTVNFDSPGLGLDSSAGVAIGVELTPGDLVLPNGICFVPVAWNGSEPSPDIQLGVSPVGDLTTSIQVMSWPGDGVYDPQSAPATSLGSLRGYVVQPDETLSVFVYAPDATTGQAVIYAVLATPLL